MKRIRDEERKEREDQDKVKDEMSGKIEEEVMRKGKWKEEQSKRVEGEEKRKGGEKRK